MADKRGTCGGVNYALVTKARSLCLTGPNTTATLHLTLTQVEKLIEILERGAKRLKADRKLASVGTRGRLRVNVRLGTRQKRIFVPGVEKAADSGKL
jgi:hypothetical protein